MQGKTPEELAECASARHELAELMKECGALTTALGDETRQAIICVLLEAEEVGLRVGEITKATHLSRPAVSHHLKVLKDAGAITVIKRGTKNFYFLDAASPAWATFWKLSDATRTLIQVARSKGYPSVYKDIELE